eukprot:9599575-Karenia_brevis.AAC.1
MWTYIQPRAMKRKRGQMFTPSFAEGEPDIEKVVKFLTIRTDENDRPLIDGLEAPESRGHGWYELKNKMFDESKLPKRMLGPYQGWGG